MSKKTKIAMFLFCFIALILSVTGIATYFVVPTTGLNSLTFSQALGNTLISNNNVLLLGSLIMCAVSFVITIACIVVFKLEVKNNKYNKALNYVLIISNFVIAIANKFYVFICDYKNVLLQYNELKGSTYTLTLSYSSTFYSMISSFVIQLVNVCVLTALGIIILMSLSKDNLEKKEVLE